VQLANASRMLADSAKSDSQPPPDRGATSTSSELQARPDRGWRRMREGHSLYDPRRLDRQRPETPFDGTWVDHSNACHLGWSHRGHDSVRNCWPVLRASRSLCCMGRVSRLAARSGSSRECSRASARAGLIHLLIAAQAIVGEPHSQRRLGCVAEKLSQRSVVSSLSWLCSANVQQPF